MAQVKECGGYWGWTRSRLTVWRFCRPSDPLERRPIRFFSAAPQRLLQRFSVAQRHVQNRREPAKQLIWTQARVEMGDMHAAGSHPARTLGLCAAHKAPGHHRGSPSCARGAGKGRVSGLVGRVWALKSSPYANLRAGLAEIPNTPRGAPRGCCTLEGWPAGPKKGLSTNKYLLFVWRAPICLESAKVQGVGPKIESLSLESSQKLSL